MKCRECQSIAIYNADWDAFYCDKCNEWLEPQCNYSYPDCDFDCENRPDKPMEKDER